MITNMYNDEDSPLIDMRNKDNKYIITSNNNDKKHNYFSDNSFMIIILKNDSHGRSLRAMITFFWGWLSMLSGFTILITSFKFSVERSLFISVAAILTIGYGPSIDANNKEDHYLLSGYFVLCVLPFTILQAITVYDAMQSNAELIHYRINEKIKINKTIDASVLFRNEVGYAVFKSMFILLLLIIIGTITYRYTTSDQRTWTDAFFNCAATITTVGYGVFNIENVYAYYVLTLFAVFSAYSVNVITVNIGGLVLAATQNLDNNYVIKDMSSNSNSNRDENSDYNDRDNIAIL